MGLEGLGGKDSFLWELWVMSYELGVIFLFGWGEKTRNHIGA